MTISKLKVLSAATLAGVITLGGMQAAAQLGEAGRSSSARQQELIHSIDKIQNELVESARRNADLQKLIGELRGEIESLRAGQPDGAPKSAAATDGGLAKPAVSARAGESPAGKRARNRGTGGQGGAAVGGRGGMSGRGMGMGGGSGIGMGGGPLVGGMGGAGMGMGAGFGPGGAAFTGGGFGGMGGGGFGGGFGGGGFGRGRAGGGGDPSEPSYIRVGGSIIITSPEGDRVATYDTATGASKAFRLSPSKKPQHEVSPLVGNRVVTFAISGPKITRIAALSLDDLSWHSQDLREPVEKASPIVGLDTVFYTLGRYVYAFSVTAKRWDVLELSEETDATPVMAGPGNPTATLEHKGHVYIFSPATGKWTDINTRAILDAPEANDDSKPKQ